MVAFNAKYSRPYMDGWRDGLNRLWRDGVTILPRPTKKIATAKNNRPVPVLEKKTPPRPVPSKKKTTPSRLGKKKPAPSRLGTNTTACVFFSLSCCTFISYCSLVSTKYFFVFSFRLVEPLPHRHQHSSPLSLCLAVMDAYLNPQPNSGAGQPPQ